MLKSLLAVLAAAIGAVIIIGLTPEPPAAASVVVNAQSDQDASNAASSDRAARSGRADEGRLTTRPCMRAWPYYEQSCLRDRARPQNLVHAARIIPLDHPSEDRILRSARL